MFTETNDLETELEKYIEQISSLGGIDTFLPRSRA